MLADLASSGAIPSLELSLRFAGERQKLIAHNIANASTPDFRPLDVDPAHFAQTLRGLIDQRRSKTGGEHGILPSHSSKQIRFGADGRVTLNPRVPSGNILFHDRNNRDMERLMQDNAENVAAYRLTAELLRGRYEILKSAIAERA